MKPRRLTKLCLELGTETPGQLEGQDMQDIRTRRSRIQVGDDDTDVHASAEKGKVTMWCDEDDDKAPFQLTMDASEARWLAAMLTRLADVSEHQEAKEKAA